MTFIGRKASNEGMRKPLPSLDSLKVFAACVRHGNFSRAAAELCVTPTAVSQRMRALESQLGAKLFRRHGPQLITTDRAKALGQRLEYSLSTIHVAIDEFCHVRHPLRVTCAPTFAARWLVPRLAAYHALPGANAISLDASQAPLPPGSFDVAIRSGTGPWPGYDAIRLLVEQGTPMLSPKWLPRKARMSLKAFLKVPLILDPRWSAWFKLARVPNCKPVFVSTRFPNYELEAQAAAQGLGAALLSPVLFADLMAQGVLIAPFNWMIEGPASYWLLATEDASETHFAKWIKAQFNALV